MAQIISIGRAKNPSRQKVQASQPWVAQARMLAEIVREWIDRLLGMLKASTQVHFGPCLTSIPLFLGQFRRLGYERETPGDNIVWVQHALTPANHAAHAG